MPKIDWTQPLETITNPPTPVHFVGTAANGDKIVQLVGMDTCIVYNKFGRPINGRVWRPRIRNKFSTLYHVMNELAEIMTSGDFSVDEKVRALLIKYYGDG